MLKSRSGFFTRITLIILVGFVAGPDSIGQEADSDGGSEDLESEDVVFIPKSGLELSIDYLKLGSFLLDFETKYEVGVGILYKNKIRLAGDWGYGKLKPQRAIKNGEYISEGTYYRVGADWVSSIDPRNNVYAGLRYAKGMFEDRATFTIESDLWDDFNGNLDRPNLEADWFELVIGSENNIWNNLFIGWVFRFRILNEYTSFEGFDVYTIPGYGRPINNTIPAVNLYVKYLLAL